MSRIDPLILMHDSQNSIKLTSTKGIIAKTLNRSSFDETWLKNSFKLGLYVLIVVFYRNGTSFVSLYIPAKDQLNKVMGHLNQELAGAENIKSRQTRQSVISAITSVRESKFKNRTNVFD